MTMTNTLAFAAVLIAASGVQAVERHSFHVTSDPDVRVHVREVRDPTTRSSKLPVILLHGARVPGIASFDLPVEGGSLASDLAKLGHRVYIMDARGYGSSSRPGQDGPRDGQPLVRSREVIKDIAAVVKDVRSRTGAQQVALLGWATGGHWAGMYASENPDMVSHVVIYNSLYGGHAGHQMLGPGTDTADPQDPTRFNVAKFGAYRLNTAASLVPAWDFAIPGQDKSQWRDPEVLKAYQEAAIASDPTSVSRYPPSFRAPSGAMADSFELASGRKLWDANRMTSHVLLIRSVNDFWSRPEDVTMLRKDLTRAASVQVVNIDNATHYVHLDRRERGRGEFMSAVTRFLGTPVDATQVSR